MKTEITHKVIKSEGIDHGMNYSPIVSNEVIKIGSEDTIRKYFADLYIRSLKQAEEDAIKNCKRAIRSKNGIRITTKKGTIILFEVRKLTSKEYLENN